LIVAGLLYYSGSSARIASQYTAVAAPASQALTAEVDGYTTISATISPRPSRT